MYGVADVDVEYLTHAGGDNSVVRMSSGNYAGSRWGLRGTEDLGGGLKGIFALERAASKSIRAAALTQTACSTARHLSACGRPTWGR